MCISDVRANTTSCLLVCATTKLQRASTLLLDSTAVSIQLVLQGGLSPMSLCAPSDTVLGCQEGVYMTVQCLKERGLTRRLVTHICHEPGELALAGQRQKVLSACMQGSIPAFST